MNIYELKAKLKENLDQMDIPEKRKEDLNWLARNLAIRNRSHPLFHKTILLLGEIFQIDNEAEGDF